MLSLRPTTVSAFPLSIVLASLLVGGDALLAEVIEPMQVASDCSGVSLDFPGFVQKYGRTYEVGTEEYDTRHALFRERSAAVGRHNCDPAAGPWTAEVNHLADWTRAELTSLNGHRSSRRSNSPASLQDRMPTFLATRGRGARAPSEPLPTSFSWGNLSTISAPSEDQGACGSCWAVASGVVMRARAEIKGMKKDFSTDQIIACTLNPHKCGGTGGCDGATAELAYEYVLRASLVTASEYRSTGLDKMHCPAKMKVDTEVATPGVIEADGSEVHLLSKTTSDLRGMDIGMYGWTKLPENKEEPLMRALMQDGPLYVAVAVGDHWFHYSGGVMTSQGCEPNNVINHAVTLFAWGVKEKTRLGPVSYWHIKNSWGANWGEEGNVRLHRKDDEEKVCGWDVKPQEGSGCEGGPKKVWVCGACGILYDAVAPHF